MIIILILIAIIIVSLVFLFYRTKKGKFTIIEAITFLIFLAVWGYTFGYILETHYKKPDEKEIGLQKLKTGEKMHYQIVYREYILGTDLENFTTKPENGDSIDFNFNWCKIFYSHRPEHRPKKPHEVLVWLTDGKDIEEMHACTSLYFYFTNAKDAIEFIHSWSSGKLITI